ncbi:hypothetical protein C8R43DRAFT_1134908 [Mycena crocata]|nr:hypothetical protein C8R43DRAFT_1134908 [Mycena crocata]
MDPAHASGEDNKSAFAASNFRNRIHPSQGNHGKLPSAGAPTCATSSRLPWPEGKTVKEYEFTKRDDVHSERPPANGVCYVCSSAKHFARDCPHYGKWLSMRDVNMLQVEISHEAEESDYNEGAIKLNSKEELRPSVEIADDDPLSKDTPPPAVGTANEERPSGVPLDDVPLVGELKANHQSSLREHYSREKAFRSRLHPPGFASLGI